MLILARCGDITLAGRAHGTAGELAGIVPRAGLSISTAVARLPHTRARNLRGGERSAIKIDDSVEGANLLSANEPEDVEDEYDERGRVAARDKIS